MATTLTSTYPFVAAARLKTLCDDAQGAAEIVAERVDDHFLQAELVQFSLQLRCASIDLRKAMFRLDAPDDFREGERPIPRAWDTALTNRDRFAMVLDVENRVKALLDELRSALCETLPAALAETIRTAYLEVKRITRHLRVMREMVNPY